MWWVVLAALTQMRVTQGQETCLSADENPYFHFGTKTSYIFASVQIPKTGKEHEVTGCSPIAIWLLNRHGSHNPEADEIVELQKMGDLKNNIITNYANGNFRDTNQRICAADLDLLKTWQWNYRHNSTYAGDLTSDGYMSTQNLAMAWKNKYPALFTASNRQNYLFKFVNDKRSSNTFKAFTEGLFGTQAEGFDVPRENDEKLLRPYKFCEAWKREVDENNNTMSQRDIFESKMEFQEMISNISLRLGFNYNIQKDTIYRIYQLCRYNKAWAVEKISPWCAAFTKDDLKRLEYAEDLETYYRYGYGTELNQKIGCAPIKDMMDFFHKHTERDEPQQPKVMIQFTEAPTVLLTLSALGSRHDSAPLTGDNYHTKQVQDRKWISSTLSPFNANLAAVLYKCTTNGNFQVNDQYQVLFLENERPMNLEGCRVGLCAWNLVKSKYADVANKCNLKFCNSASKTTGLLGTFVALIVFICRYSFSEY